MANMIDRAEHAVREAWAGLMCGSDNDSRTLARAALRAALDRSDLETVGAVARALRQTEVNDGEDGWTHLHAADRAAFLTQAQAAIAALRKMVEE